MNDLNFAIQDVAAEIRNGVLQADAIDMVSGDYHLNPILLRNSFARAFPNGVPQVDVKKAEELLAAHKAKKEEKAAAEMAAIREFFAINPHHRQGLEKVLRQFGI